MSTKLSTVLFCFSTLLLASCSFSTNSNGPSPESKDVFGSWNLTKESLKNQDGKAATEVITSFELHADSTAVVYFKDSGEKENKGTWSWQAEKKLGNDNFGISFTTDVLIYVNGLPRLGLLLNPTDKGINLTSDTYTFEKVE